MIFSSLKNTVFNKIFKARQEMKSSSEFTFVLRPSPIGGVGVFATHDIKKGTQVFTGEFSPRKMKIAEIPKELKMYCIFINDEECLCPKRFDRMEIDWFVNHSKNPNVEKTPQGTVFALRDIHAGEEIVCDYNNLGEPDHLKEDYYRPC